jgi:hypothetical protein
LPPQVVSLSDCRWTQARGARRRLNFLCFFHVKTREVRTPPDGILTYPTLSQNHCSDWA